jgi:membrane protein DedA with SNARE-associated domain
LIDSTFLLTRPPTEIMLGIVSLSLATEDGALALAMIVLQQKLLPYSQAWLSATFGIILGDFLVYGGAYFVRTLEQRLKKVLPVGAIERWRERIEAWMRAQGRALDFALIVSHLVPGTRFVLYCAAGWTGYSFRRYSFLLGVSTALWVAFVLLAGQSLLTLFHPKWWMSVVLVLGLMILMRQIGRWTTKK